MPQAPVLPPPLFQWRSFAPFFSTFLLFFLFLCAFHCVLLLFFSHKPLFSDRTTQSGPERLLQYASAHSGAHPHLGGEAQGGKENTSHRRDGDSTVGRWLAVSDEEQLLHPVSRGEGRACLCWLLLRFDARTPLSFQLRKSYAGLACLKYAPFLRDKSSSLASTHHRVSSFSYTKRADVCCPR